MDLEELRPDIKIFKSALDEMRSSVRFKQILAVRAHFFLLLMHADI